MNVTEYPQAIARAALSLYDVKKRLREVRGEMEQARTEAHLRILNAREPNGKLIYRFEVERRTALAVALAEDPRHQDLRLQEQSLLDVRADSQSRLTRLVNEFNLAVTGRGQGSFQQGGVN